MKSSADSTLITTDINSVLLASCLCERKKAALTLSTNQGQMEETQRTLQSLGGDSASGFCLQRRIEDQAGDLGTVQPHPLMVDSFPLCLLHSLLPPETGRRKIQTKFVAVFSCSWGNLL
ncbi:hypothetical protein Q8A67_024636 [Cirrhinus molitorella]|uniref:Uncharacterized protein n=1 Tax=Cirrhinus molitorella TaxID=172907 RepID=A0AA88TDP1_9TELE|nr:hypothetical protein Q8A67_024636 [Cirrhinus molitorella]